MKVVRFKVIEDKNRNRITVKVRKLGIWFYVTEGECGYAGCYKQVLDFNDIDDFTECYMKIINRREVKFIQFPGKCITEVYTN